MYRLSQNIATVFMKQLKIFLSIIIILLLGSCTRVPEKWTGINLSKNHSQIVSTTHNYTLKWVDAATLSALDQMDIMIIEVTPSPDGNSIKAATIDHDIFIKLKSVNPSSTLMQIDIKLTDKGEHVSIGNEIMDQTEKYLLGNSKIDTTNFAEGFDFNKENFPAK